MTVTGDGFSSAPRSADGGDDAVNGFDDGGWTSDDEAPPASRAAGYAPAATWIDEDDEGPPRPTGPAGGAQHGAQHDADGDGAGDDFEEYVAVPRGDDYIADTVVEEQPESDQQLPITAFEEIASSWVPPWARAQ